MTDYTYNLKAPAAFRPELVDLGDSQRSILSGAVKNIVRPRYWRWTVEWVNVNGTDLIEIEAFFNRVQRDDRVNFRPYNQSNRGTWGGTPVVDGASQSGDTLNIRGGTISTTNYARAGDWLLYSNGIAKAEIKLVTADADTDSSGDASIPIAPAIHTAPPDGGSIFSASPLYGLFVLESVSAPTYDGNNQLAGGAYAGSITVVLSEDV